jgi:hypothetical protein
MVRDPKLYQKRTRRDSLLDYLDEFELDDLYDEPYFLDEVFLEGDEDYDKDGRDAQNDQDLERD